MAYRDLGAPKQYRRIMRRGKRLLNSQSSCCFAVGSTRVSLSPHVLAVGHSIALYTPHTSPDLQTPRPSTEPQNPETPKVHFKVRKMPFWTPRQNDPQSQLKCPKTHSWTFVFPKNGFFGHFNWLLEPFCRGVQNGIFRILKCTFGV